MKKLSSIGMFAAVASISAFGTLWLEHRVINAQQPETSASPDAEEDSTPAVTYGEPEKISYRSSPALSELNTTELGGDISGDGQRDQWVVSILNDEPTDPTPQHPLGLFAIYNDTDGDQDRDRLTLTAGQDSTRTDIILEDVAADTTTEMKRTATFYSRKTGRTAYIDLDGDAMVDLIVQQSTDRTVRRWILHDFGLYAVREVIDKDANTFRIDLPDGKSQEVRWLDDQWTFEAR